MILLTLQKKNLIHPPPWLMSNTHMLTMMGSVAYGASSDTSDVDLYGWCIPPKDMVFPHLSGEILGFGKQKKRFEQYQEHHITDESSSKQYDITVYSIVKYFQLCMDNNPNMIDSLFVPRNCILHMSAIGQMVREKRRLFLHKGAYFKFKGYAYSQLHKMRGKNPSGNRVEIREKYGYDVKFAYHLIRLLYECQQILEEGDINLQKNREHLKAIRRGEVPQEDIIRWFQSKEEALEKLYSTSTLQHSPDESKIKQLLVDCLEHAYGNLSNCVVVPDKATSTIKQIKEIIENFEKIS